MSELFKTVKTVKDEALLEMLLMKVPDSIIQQFLKEKVCVADEELFTYRLPNEDEQHLLIEFKKRHPLWCPYLILKNKHQLAICAAGTNAGDAWNYVRQNLTILKQSQAYIFDFIEDKDYGLLGIRFEQKDGFIFRVDDWEETLSLLKEAEEIARIIEKMPNTDL